MAPRGLSDLLCELILHAPPLSADEEAEAMVSMEDTLAVALAGWETPVSRACRTALNLDARPFFAGGEPGPPEGLALQLGVAAHALDYDDVHMTSVTHPSAVIFPALLALAALNRVPPESILQGYAVGLATNIALGQALGAGHYEAGWHATSTIGALAAAAALANALKLDEPAARSALALAAAQAGGLQRNFGAMAKPVQAGNAAAAAVRAALLAAAGVTADQDIFGPRGFLELYAAGAPAGSPKDQGLPYQLNSVSRKLFPCCYAAHRMIAAALVLRRRLEDEPPPKAAKITALAPFASLTPLRVVDPKTGPEGQFCASYIIASALITGGVNLDDFTDEAVNRPDVRDLMARIDVHEAEPETPTPVGLDHGRVQLTMTLYGRTLARAEVTAFPGSPSAPADARALEAKVKNCLSLYNRTAERPITPSTFKAILVRFARQELEPAL